MDRCLDESLLLDLFQGVLTPQSAAEVQAHIDRCNACRRLVAEVAKSPEVAPPPPEPAPVRVVIRDGKVSQRPMPAAAPASIAATVVSPAQAASEVRTLADLAPGAVVAQRYRLERLLGEGGTGLVWSATHLLMRKGVALKFLKLTEFDAVRRFMREARVSAALRHPNVIEVHDFFLLPSQESPVMVMDLLVGESLGARLRREGKLSVHEGVRVLLAVTSALAAAHAHGVVHRDLKPDNIFLQTRPGALPDVKVLDFGLAKLTAAEGDAASTAHLTRSGHVLGTPHYMAPEQVVADKDVDHRADIWALGVIAYQTLSGRRPFEGRGMIQVFREISAGKAEPLAKLDPSLPKPLAKLVMRMIEKKRSARPSLEEVRAGLAAFG